MSAIELAGGKPLTADHCDIDPVSGQQKGYIVLTADERTKGFVRPVRRSYVHEGCDIMQGCGAETTMSQDIAETYARQPDFYTGTFCSKCRIHFPLDQFVWTGTNEIVGT